MSATVLATRTDAREALYEAYADRLKVNPDLDRSLVSFQADKAEPFYRWYRYKEGFSSRLVAYCLAEIGRRPGVLLDPFAGAGAALFASRDLGWNAIGIELLPVGLRAIDARLAGERVDADAFADQVARASGIRFADLAPAGCRFPHIAITRGAFPDETEQALGGYLAYVREHVADRRARRLFEFAALCILEEVSYTRKDGQYLRWDSRSPKKTTGRPFDKGPIPTFQEAIIRKLRRMSEDISRDRRRPGSSASAPPARGRLDVRKGSCLEILPAMPDAAVDLVLTSPPYCNRYDYTRTYALELAFLGCGDDDVKRLRQRLLSSTVENRPKAAELRALYGRLGAADRLERVEAVFRAQPALREVLAILEHYGDTGRLNNTNITRMVRGYFHEMCFVVAELARILRPGGKVVMVNDNVRYAGEEVPVDLILSDFARSFGLEVRHIWTLPTGKGNSSQQMGAHGRQELRKAVCLWQKPGRRADMAWHAGAASALAEAPGRQT